MRPKADEDQATKYYVYLLRIWSAKEDGQATWRASLEAAQTSQKLGFARLEDLFAYLQAYLQTRLQDNDQRWPGKPEP